MKVFLRFFGFWVLCISFQCCLALDIAAEQFFAAKGGHGIHRQESISDKNVCEITEKNPCFGIVKVNLPKEEAQFVAVDMAFEGDLSSSVQLIINIDNKQKEPELYLEQPIRSDGKMHRYVFDLAQSVKWLDLKRVVSIRLNPVKVGCKGDYLQLKGVCFASTRETLSYFNWITSYKPEEFDFSCSNPFNQIFLAKGSHGLENREIVDGVLCCNIVGADPSFPLVVMNRPLNQTNCVAVEMAYKGAPGEIRIFYNDGFSSSGYTAQALIPDGKFHVYTFEFDQRVRLKDVHILENFRLCPVFPGVDGEAVKIHYIRLFASDARPDLPVRVTVPPLKAGELKVDQFLQVTKGGEAAAKTKLALGYDEEGLRIRFSTSLDNVRYVGAHKRRDGAVYNDDSFEFMFLTAPDKYYQVVINPVNALFDMRFEIEHFNMGISHIEWDSQARVSSKIKPGSWFGEIKVPFAPMGISGIPKIPWRINALRNSVADGKGVSSWNRYNGHNHQVSIFKELVFGEKASPRLSLIDRGKFYPGMNVAVFSNPDRAEVTGVIRVRNLETGKDEKYTATSNTAKITVPYKIAFAGKHQIIAGIGDGESYQFVDIFDVDAPDLGKALEGLLEALHNNGNSSIGKEQIDRRAELLGVGENLSRSFKQNGTMDCKIWEEFQKDCKKWQSALQLEKFKQITRKYFSNPNAPFAVAGADSMVKIFRSMDPEYPAFEGHAIQSLELEAAGNEIEGTQLLLFGLEEPVEITTIMATDLVGKNASIPASQIGIYEEKYIDVSEMRATYPISYYGKWPEMLPPFRPITLKPGMINPIWIKVSVPMGMPAGDYNGTICVQAKGALPVSIPITMKVWDFSLPRTSTFRTAVSIFWKNIVDYYAKKQPDGKLTDEQQRVIMENLAQFMLKNRMNPSNIYDSNCYSGKPVPFPLSDRYAEYKKMGLNALAIANLTPHGFSSPSKELRDWYYSKDRMSRLFESIQKNYDRATKGGIAPALYIHAFDEIFAHEDVVGKSKVLRDMLIEWRAKIPEIKVECISYVLPELIGTVNIWCPSFIMMETEYDKFMERRKAGDEIWLYTCLGSPAKGNPPSFVLEAKSIDLRMVGWLCKKFHADGFLYYSICHWGRNYPEAGHSWPELPWQPVYNPGFNGEAVLIYPAYSWQEEPSSSVRFENLRDGFEDYDYLSLLEKYWNRGVGKKASVEETREVEALLSTEGMVQTSRSYNQDYKRLRKKRRRIAQLIEQFSKAEQ